MTSGKRLVHHVLNGLFLLHSCTVFGGLTSFSKTALVFNSYMRAMQYLPRCHRAPALLCNLNIVFLTSHPRTTLNFSQKRPSHAVTHISMCTNRISIGSVQNPNGLGITHWLRDKSLINPCLILSIQWRSSIGSDGCEAILCSLDLLHIEELISHHTAAPPATGISPRHYLAILPDGSKGASHAIS